MALQHPLRYACAYIAIFVVTLCAGPASGQVNSVDSLLQRAHGALVEGRVDEARSTLERAVVLDTERADAYHLLAKTYLQAEPPDLDGAKAANSRALEIEPENADYLSLRLARWHYYPSSFIPGLRTGRTEDLAERIIGMDPGNEVAHVVLGEIALSDYRKARASVSFPDLDNLDVPAPREAFFNAAYLLNPVLEPHVEDSAVRFEGSRRYSSRRMEYVTKESEARKRYDRAVEHLRSALEANRANPSTYRSLLTAAVLADDIEVAEEAVRGMVESLPNVPESWMYRGLVSFRRNRVAEANAAFDTGLTLMSDELSAVYRSTTERLRKEGDGHDGNGAGVDFFASRDPFLLTSENERRLEHLSRLTYADLRFGGLYPDRRGWETEPGEVVMRYGVPLGEAQNSTRLDRYLVLHYGDFFFKFMDLAKSGRLTFYSPKVGDGAADFEEIERAFEDDFTLVSQQLFREIPERFVFDRHGTRLPLPYQVASFLEGGDQLDVIVSLGVPIEDEDGDPAIRSGLWLLDEEGATVASDSGRAVPGMTVRRSDEAYQSYVRRVRAGPGRYTVVVEFDRPGRDVAGFHRRPLELRSFPPGTPSVSDILLCYSVEEQGGETPDGLFRGGYVIEPAPWGAYNVGQPIYVFFETYNFVPSGGGRSTYRVEALMVPFKGKEDLPRAAERAFRRSGRRGGVSVSYSAVASETVESQYLILDTQGAESGTYLVGLRLTDDESGRELYSGRAVVLE